MAETENPFGGGPFGGGPFGPRPAGGDLTLPLPPVQIAVAGSLFFAFQLVPAQGSVAVAGQALLFADTLAWGNGAIAVRGFDLILYPHKRTRSVRSALGGRRATTQMGAASVRSGAAGPRTRTTVS